MSAQPLQPPRHPEAADSIICVVEKPPMTSTEAWLGKPQVMKIVEIAARRVVNGRFADPISVQLRGTKIQGALPRENQWLEIRPADMDGHGRVRRLRNLSTGHEIKTRTNPWSALARI
jgi:hypothetical protein